MLDCRIVLIIIKFLSYMPLLTFSDDRYFGEIRKSQIDCNHLRFSIFSIKLGVRSYYLLTWTKTNKIRLFFSQNLYMVQNYPDEVSLDNTYDEYKSELLDNNNEDAKLIHKEALQYKISETEQIKNSTFNKFLAYLALIVFIIPLFSDYFENIYKYKKVYQLIFIIFILYQCINIMILSYSFIKVKSVPRVTFKSIRKSEKTLDDFILMLFYEWRSQEQEKTMQVSLIKNIEKYIVSIVLSCFFLLIVHNVIHYITPEKDDGTVGFEQLVIYVKKDPLIEKSCIHTFYSDINAVNKFKSRIDANNFESIFCPNVKYKINSIIEMEMN